MGLCTLVSVGFFSFMLFWLYHYQQQVIMSNEDTVNQNVSRNKTLRCKKTVNRIIRQSRWTVVCETVWDGWSKKLMPCQQHYGFKRPFSGRRSSRTYRQWDGSLLLNDWYSVMTTRVKSLLTIVTCMSDRNVPWPRRMLTLVTHIQYADGTDRQTDGRQTVTLRFPLRKQNTFAKQVT